MTIVFSVIAEVVIFAGSGSVPTLRYEKLIHRR